MASAGEAGTPVYYSADEEGTPPSFGVVMDDSLRISHMHCMAQGCGLSAGPSASLERRRVIIAGRVKHNGMIAGRDAGSLKVCSTTAGYLPVR